MSQNEPVSVRILDREYTVGVEPAERDSLTGLYNRAAALDRIEARAHLRDHPRLEARKHLDERVRCQL